jgi:hypothetical protein
MKRPSAFLCVSKEQIPKYLPEQKKSLKQICRKGHKNSFYGKYKFSVISTNFMISKRVLMRKRFILRTFLKKTPSIYTLVLRVLAVVGKLTISKCLSP